VLNLWIEVLEVVYKKLGDFSNTSWKDLDVGLHFIAKHVIFKE